MRVLIKNVIRTAVIGIVCVMSALFLSGCNSTEGRHIQAPDRNMESISKNVLDIIADPNTTDDAFVYVNNNVPFFTDEEITSVNFISYFEVDGLGRSGSITACLSKETMPAKGEMMTEQPEQIKPSGWHRAKYDFIDGGCLYECRKLIGYWLLGEDANENNLITATRYLSINGMLPFEQQVGNYMRRTGNHVMYRVTPVFSDCDALCKGVLMEAKSVEDDELEFCVFCYNKQPGVTIDFETGLSTEI